MTTPSPHSSGLPDLSSLFPWRVWWSNPTLRSWPVWVFVALVAVPPLALVVMDAREDSSVAVGSFAFYFAAAWFLILWIAVRPRNLTGAMYAEIVVIALVTQVPLALWLEEALPADLGNLASTIFAIGVPEELAKVLPVVVLALVHRSTWTRLRPQDYLFLGAVSGLAFGAQEAIQYYNTNYSDDLTRSDALGLMWRFLSDPITHACWAGVAGYFVGLAMRHRDARTWAAVAGLGLAIPAVLHGINDWDAVTGNILWVVLTVFSAVLFLAYAKVGIAPSATTSPPPITHTPGPTPTPAPGGWRRAPDGTWRYT